MLLILPRGFIRELLYSLRVVCVCVCVCTCLYVCTLVLYRLPDFRSILISDYFTFQTANISIRYRLLQTYNKTYKNVKLANLLVQLQAQSS